VLEHPAHREVPEIASDGPTNGKKDDIGGMILAEQRHAAPRL
jgi:hypothetical protein